MNTFLIQSLIPALIGSGRLNSVPSEQIEESLNAGLAKAWLAETGKHLCGECYGEWSYPQDNIAEILNGRWETSPCGRKAASYTKIRVFGGFLDQAGNEYVPRGKDHRPEDIRHKGWS